VLPFAGGGASLIHYAAVRIGGRVVPQQLHQKKKTGISACSNLSETDKLT
jgi:hypothetical protein